MREIWKIITYTKKFRNYYFILSVFVILLALLNQVAPLLTKQIVDLIVARLNGHPASLQILVLLLALILLSDIVITIITDISQYIGDIMAVKLNNYLTEKFYRHVLALSIDYYDNEITGKIVNKLDRGIFNITNLIAQAVNNFLPFFISTIVTLFIISFYSWELAILLLLLFPIYIYISHKSSVSWGKIEGQKNAILDKTLGRVYESLSSIRVVKSFIQESTEFSFFRRERDKMVGLTQRQSKEWHIYDFYRRIVLNIVMFAIFGYIIYFTFQGRFSIGVMTLLLQLANQARFPLFAMSFIIGQIQQAQAGCKDFFEVLETETTISDSPAAQPLLKVTGQISFDHVNFAYKNGSQVLHDISLTVQKGKKLAIVGESGEGKSTIASLLLRFYEPQSGSISIDNVPIHEITLQSLREHIGVVFQDTFLFSGSVMDNINYGASFANEKMIKEAAMVANADEFISKLPQGYLTQIGERGVKLSGGQKQRIAIARALLKNPPILIFDEATSSLDSKAEFEVQKALDKLMEGRTTIIIAHRLSTIRNVDDIIVLKNGRIIEQGKPKQLEKQHGIYATLLSYQNMSGKSNSKLKEFNIES